MLQLIDAGGNSANARLIQLGSGLELTETSDGLPQISIDGGAVGASLSTLSDVNLTALSNNEFLRYNATAGEWVNTLLATSDIPNLDTSKLTTGTLPVARGGTGLASLTTGNYLRAQSSSALEQRTPAQVLADIGAAAAAHVHSAADITSGTLAVARGGTGIASYTTNNYIRASGATTLEQRTPAQVLADIGAAASSHVHAATDITSGTLASARLSGAYTGITGLGTLTSLAITGGTATVRAAATQDGVILAGRAGGTGTWAVTLTPTTLSANRTVTLANGDTTLVAGTMVPDSRTATITNGTGITGGGAAQPFSGNLAWTIGLTGQALALHNLATNGLIARTGAGTVAGRTLTGTANQVTVTNGDGVSGNPTLSLPQDIHTTATPSFSGLLIGAAPPAGAEAVRIDGSLRVGGTIYANDFVLLGGAGSLSGLLIDSLDDVIINTAAEGHYLRYTTGYWRNQAIALGDLGTGTPSASNFLRGDGTWASAYIAASDEGTPLTTQATEFNFTGAGVVASNVGGVVTVNITGAVTSVFGRTGAIVATEGDYSLNLLSDVTITAVASGHFLRHNGTAFVNTALVAADIPNIDTSKLTTGTLGVARGGTGIASYTTNNYIRASGATTLEQRTPAQVLSDIGAAAASHAHSAADITSGTLVVARGGTGVATITGMVKGNGTSAFSAAVAGTDYVIPSGSITGNAGTATTLQNARTLWGQSFNGSANIGTDLHLSRTVGGQVMGRLIAATYHELVALTANLYVAAGDLADPRAATELRYINAAGANNAAGGMLAIKGNNTETGVELTFHTVPTSTGANATPASSTLRFRVTGSGAGYFSGALTVNSGGIAVTGNSTITGTLSGITTLTATTIAGTLSTAAQTNITSLGTLTALQVDNLNLNGNAITSTSGGISITPLAGQVITLDGTITIDAGVVTGATSITSTAFVGALTGNASTATTLQTSRNFSLTGDVTASAIGFNGSAAVALSTSIAASVVTGKLLTGYAVGSNAVLATGDSILGAFGKVQAQLNNRVGKSAPVAFSTAGSGWYRVAIGTGANGRGPFRVVLYTEGGSWSPARLDINGWMDWGSVGHITQVLQSGTAYWTEVRVTNATGTYYLEVNFNAAVSGAVYAIDELGPGGSVSAFTALTGSLTAGSGTVVASMTTQNGISTQHDMRVAGTVYATDFVLLGGSGGTSGIQLDTLDDVVITSAASGHFLRHNGANWVNTALVAGDIPSHSHAATDITSGTLAVARGGTGIASYTTNNYIRASGATTLEQRTPAQVLSDIGAAAASHGHSGADITSGTVALARLTTTGTGPNLMVSYGRQADATNLNTLLESGVYGLHGTVTNGPGTAGSYEVLAVFRNSDVGAQLYLPRNGTTPVAVRGWSSSGSSFTSWRELVDTALSQTIGGTKTFSSTIVGSISGSAATLTTTRTIWGQNFNGSAAVSGALSGATTIDASGNITTSGGRLRAGTVSATGGAVLVDSNYSNGTLNVLGTMYSSGATLLAFGVRSSTTTSNAFLSATGINIGRSAFVANSDEFKWYTASAQTVSVDSAITLTERMALTSSALTVAVGIAVTGNSTITGTLTVTGNITANSSDRRLKTNAQRIENAIDRIMQLEAVTHTWNDLAARLAGYDTTERMAGLYAQDVQKVLPEAVKIAPFDNDGTGRSKSGKNFLTVQYERIVPLLVAGQQELFLDLRTTDAKVEELTARIEQLQAEVEALKGGSNGSAGVR